MTEENVVVELDTSYPACLEELAEKRRAFILECMASPEIDGKILVQNMATVENWLIGNPVKAVK